LRRDYATERNLSGEQYVQLISWCASHSAYVGFIVFPKSDLSNRARVLLNAAEGRHAVKREVTHWPGTNLDSASATMYLMPASVTAEIILPAGANLFAWQPPDLPEDLFFLREDESPVLSVTAHEEHAVLSLNAREFDEIKRDLSWLPEMLTTA
jgi:hypothetical protein